MLTIGSAARSWWVPELIQVPGGVPAKTSALCHRASVFFIQELWKMRAEALCTLGQGTCHNDTGLEMVLMFLKDIRLLLRLFFSC